MFGLLNFVTIKIRRYSRSWSLDIVTCSRNWISSFPWAHDLVENWLQCVSWHLHSQSTRIILYLSHVKNKCYGRRPSWIDSWNLRWWNNRCAQILVQSPDQVFSFTNTDALIDPNILTFVFWNMHYTICIVLTYICIADLWFLTYLIVWLIA